MFLKICLKALAFLQAILRVFILSIAKIEMFCRYLLLRIKQQFTKFGEIIPAKISNNKVRQLKE